MKLPRSVTYELIDSVLRKAVPEDGVVRLGEGVELVDSKILKFLQNGEPWLIAKRRDGDMLICAVWNGRTHSGNHSFPISDFTDNQYQIKHYYGPSTLYFNSISDYALGYYLKLPYLLIHAHRLLDRAGTFLYNKRRIVLKQRLELLTFMIEQAAEGKSEFSSLDLMTDMHTIRWITHPAGESVQSRLELYLDSLVDTGELQKIDSKYRLKGPAIRLVEERAEAERRHRQSIRIQWLIAALTTATVLLTVFQSGLVKLKPLLDLTNPGT